MAFPETPPRLATDRLVLRLLEDDDAPALFAILSDPPTMRYWSTPPWTSLDQAAAMIARAREGFAARDALRFAIVEAAGDALIGTCTLFGIDATHRRAEVGYILARDRWGRGLMREALTALLDFAFGPLGLHRAEADADPRNVASVGLLERLGFAREGFLRERWRVGSEVTNSVFLGLLEPAWTLSRRGPATRTEPDAPAQWPEDWRTFHLHGLACLLRSGRTTPELFTTEWDGEGARLPHLIPPKGTDEAWSTFVNSRLLAGVGAEILLQGLYTKRGYSLRAPGDPRNPALTRRGDAAPGFDPRRMAPLGVLLADMNLALLGGPAGFAPLRAAERWRDEAAQTALGWSYDASWDKYEFGLAVRDLHAELLADADEAHRDAVRRVLAGGEAPA